MTSIVAIVALVAGVSCDPYDIYDTYCPEPYDDAYDEYCSYAYVEPFVGDGVARDYVSAIPDEPQPHENPDIDHRQAEDTVRPTHIAYVIPHQDESDGTLPTEFEGRYPCGDDGETMTLCANPGADPDDSPRLLVLAITAEELPRDDPDNHYVVGLVFDANADEGDNFEPPAEQANHYFGGTDRWYRASYAPGDGWRFDVVDVSSGEEVSASSNARLVFQGESLALVVPTSEFDVEAPGVRLTIFRHGGDNGEGPDNNWSGFVFPSLGDPLIVPE